VQAQASIPPELTNGVQIETQSLLYNAAFLEISDMFDGKRALSIKRAVYLPYSGNGYKPFTYNFSDIGETQDFTNQFVTKVMQTHTG